MSESVIASVPLTTSEVAEQAISALSNKQAWLLMRLGDGEALAFRSEGHYKAPVKHIDIENKPWVKHLGTIPTDVEKKQWREGTLKGMDAAAVVGLHPPSMRGRSLRDSGTFFRTAYKEHIRRECAANIHFDLQDSGQYEKMAEAATGVWLFTGHRIYTQFRRTIWKGRDSGKVKWYGLPLQSKFFDSRIQWKVWRDTIFPSIDKLPDMGGWLVLVGGGVPGKALFEHLLKKGGVVLDIGSVFDKWAGFKTRGIGKGRGVRDMAKALVK